MITKDGSIKLLNKIIADTDFDLQVRVAQNNPGTADADLVLADLTEADFAGYAAQAASGIFPGAALNGSDEAESDSPTIQYTEAGGPETQTCYLAYIDFKDVSDTRRLLAVARFPSPQVVNIDGDMIQFTLNLFAWNGVP